MTIFAKCVAALTVASLQITSARSANDIVQHVVGSRKNAELLIDQSLNRTNKLLGHFVEPGNPKQILTDAKFGVMNQIRACHEFAIVHDDLFFVVDRAESEADQFKPIEVETVASLKNQHAEIKQLSHTFCGFSKETDVPMGRPSEKLVVRLVKVRNALRRAADVTFSLPDKSTQNTPRYFADMGLYSMGIVRNHVANPDGTPRLQFKDATSHMQLAYHLAHSMVIVTAIQLTRNQQNKIAGRPDDQTCKQMISDLSDLVTEPGQAYAYGATTAPGVSEGKLSPALTKAVDVAIAAFHQVRARCTR